MNERLTDTNIDFTVTHRGFESTLNYCRVSRQQIEALPTNASIIEIGSGEYQELASGVKSMRSDVTVYSVDPTLALSSEREDIRLSRTGNSITYLQDAPRTHDELIDYKTTQRKRLKHARKTGHILTDRLPALSLPDETTNLLVDSHAACLYLGEQEFREYLETIQRVLIYSGMAHLYPIGCVRYSRVRAFYDGPQYALEMASTQIQKKLTNTNQLKVVDVFEIDGSVGAVLNKVTT